MKIKILAEATEDLYSGFHFYERQSPNLGQYFLDSLFSDIESLQIHAGAHRTFWGKHRALSKRFPFAIYYTVESSVIRVHAVLDCRRRPSWIRNRLGQS